MTYKLKCPQCNFKIDSRYYYKCPKCNTKICENEIDNSEELIINNENNGNCINCGQLTANQKAKRCWKCHVKWRNTPNYSRHRKHFYCQDCGKEISRKPGAKRCHSCANKARSEQISEQVKQMHKDGVFNHCYEKLKERIKDPKLQQKRMKALLKSPNKTEKKLLKLLKDYFPGEYKFTGNAKFFIERFCPDYVNINGQKKIIELFGSYHHKKIAKVRKTDQRKVKKYAEYGYETLVIWDYELKNKETLIKKIRKFNKKVGDLLFQLII